MTLSHRAEAAAPDEARGLLDALFEASDQTLRWPIDRIEQWNALLDINTPEAHLAAAMMLRQEGSLWAVGSMEEGPFARYLWPGSNGSYVGNYAEAKAATPALALLSAIAKGNGQ